jgi:hypothetical protein
MRSGAKFTKAVAHHRRCPWHGAKGFALAQPLGAMRSSSPVYLLLNIGLIPVSRLAAYAVQILIVSIIVALARKIAAEKREKMKQPALVGINSSWNHRRNGSVHIFDLVDVEYRRVIDFEMVQRTNASRRGNYQGSSNGMEVEAMR